MTDYLSQFLGSVSSTSKKRAFISFDYDNDESLKNLLAGQAKHSDSPFYFQDWSVKEPFPQSTWKSDVRTKIKQCSFVIVLINDNTYKASGVLEEIRIANDEQIPCFGIYQNNTGRQYYVPRGLEKRYIPWDWLSIKEAVNNLHKYRLLPPIQ